MKVTFRIPGEMYEYVEVEREFGDMANAGDIAEYREYIREGLRPKPINEMPAKEWDTFIQNWLEGKPNHTESITKLSPAQSKFYNDLKRAKSRAEAEVKRQELSELSGKAITG